MLFEVGNSYHIYNHGNNQQKIFFDRDNYVYFLETSKIHILPHADIIAWFLMPNHFHLMVYVKEVSISKEETSRITRHYTSFTCLIFRILYFKTKKWNVDKRGFSGFELIKCEKRMNKRILSPTNRV